MANNVGKKVTGYILDVVGFTFSILSLVFLTGIMMGSSYSILNQIVNDPELASYTASIQPIFDSIGDVCKLFIIPVFIFNAKLDIVFLVICLCLIIATFVLSGIARKLGAKVIHVFSYIFAGIAIIILLCAILLVVADRALPIFKTTMMGYIQSILDKFAGGMSL